MLSSHCINSNNTSRLFGEGTSNNLILNSDFHHNYDPLEYGEDADGFAVKFGSGVRNIIRGCRSFANSDDGFDLWEFTSPVTFQNNSGSDAVIGNTVDDRYNSWTLAVTVNNSDFLSLDSRIATGNRVNNKLPVSNFLKLRSTSDLIDRGVNIGLPFQQNAPDLGAFEFNPKN